MDTEDSVASWLRELEERLAEPKPWPRGLLSTWGLKALQKNGPTSRDVRPCRRCQVLRTELASAKSISGGCRACALRTKACAWLLSSSSSPEEKARRFEYRLISAHLLCDVEVFVIQTPSLRGQAGALRS